MKRRSEHLKNLHEEAPGEVRVIPNEIDVSIDGFVLIRNHHLMDALVHDPSGTLGLLEESAGHVDIDKLRVGPYGELVISDDAFHGSVVKKLLELPAEKLLCLHAEQQVMGMINIICGLVC